MARDLNWRAGFEVELILGDLGIPEFEHEAAYEPMDKASPLFCRAVAQLLTDKTGVRWSAPSKIVKPGFYVVPEHGLDPIIWPRGRLAGVELLTPPLLFDDANAIRHRISDAIGIIDGEFNFERSVITDECGWHINIDAGSDVHLDPADFVLGVDELLLLSNHDRLYTPYTGLQRHSVGIAMLKHLTQDPESSLLCNTGLSNLIRDAAGYSKRYAANFSKIDRGYVELRHFSSVAFLEGIDLGEDLERIPLAFEVPFSQSGPLERIFRRKFLLLSAWLKLNRDRVTWSMEPMSRFASIAPGHIFFDGEKIGSVTLNGMADVHLLGRRDQDISAMMRGVLLSDIAEAVALLALDLAELANIRIGRPKNRCAAFQKEITKIAKQLRRDGTFTTAHQKDLLVEARDLRREGHWGWKKELQCDP